MDERHKSVAKNKTADGLEYRIMYFDADRYEKKKRGITKLCIQRKLWIISSIQEM